MESELFLGRTDYSKGGLQRRFNLPWIQLYYHATSIETTFFPIQDGGLRQVWLSTYFLTWIFDVHHYHRLLCFGMAHADFVDTNVIKNYASPLDTIPPWEIVHFHELRNICQKTCHPFSSKEKNSKQRPCGIIKKSSARECRPLCVASCTYTRGTRRKQ